MRKEREAHTMMATLKKTTTMTMVVPLLEPRRWV